MRTLPSLTAASLLILSLHASAAAPARGDWPSHGAESDETNHSPQAEINPQTIGRLGLAWSLDLPGEASLEGTPIEVDGVVYATGSYGAVYAVAARSGRLLWTYDPQIWNHSPAKMQDLFAVNRGAAYDGGRVFSATLDGRLLALEAANGKLLWSVQTLPTDSPQTITGAPRTFRGKVIIGNGGADFGARGYVTAYDQATGRRLWRFYVVPGTPEENKADPALQRAAETWKGAYWKTGTGGGVWDSITFDADLNRMYLGTGNAGPQDPELRSPGGGDNLYTASIVALDADTGGYVWHNQLVPRDAWDFDCTQQMTLAELMLGGTLHKVLMQAPKNGFLYVLDRQNGHVLSAGKIARVTWADHIDLSTGRPVENPGMRYPAGTTSHVWPSASGAHSWQAMSFNPATGLLYIPTMQDGMTLTRGPARSGEIENAGVSIGPVPPVPPHPAATLLAWNPATQQAAWEIPHTTVWNGGTLTTGGLMVFQGTGDGYLSAYDAKTGALLWHFYAGLGIIAPPISYEAAGKQYVSVLVGYGGAAAAGGGKMVAGWSYAAPRRLLTFALDGTATLPPTPPRFLKLRLLDDPARSLDPAPIHAGEALFVRCALCHGRDAIGAGGPAPDLRASQIALDPGGFATLLHDGALAQAGMPRFADLTADQVTALYAYIRAQARIALAKK